MLEVPNEVTITSILSCKTCIEAKISQTEQKKNGIIPYVSTTGHLTTMGCSTLHSLEVRELQRQF